jgi:Tol biopolymer transport system component/DNA-binding winged helix-turn-helix (wHTH) protein
MNEVDGRRIRFGEYEADLTAGELRRGGKRLPLQEQPFQVLAALLAQPGEVVTREYLRERLWPGQPFVDFDQGLNTAVNKLRDVLGDSASHPRFIETLPRRGYRFTFALEPQRNARSIAEQLPPAPAGPRGIRRGTILLLVAGALGLAGMSAWSLRQPRIESQIPLRRFVLRTPVATPNAIKRSTAISPDGKQIVFTHSGSSDRLWVQHLDQEQPKAVEGSEGATNPFWAPDSKVVGFGATFESRLSLMRIPVEGGSVTRICEIPSGFISGAAWSPDGKTIVFGSGGPSALYEVPATGGVPRLVVTQDAIKLFPVASGVVSRNLYVQGLQFLPMQTGRRVIVFEFGGNLLNRDLDTGRTELLGPGRFPIYSPTGHLVFQSTTSSQDLRAQPFSLDTLKTTGPTFAIVQNGSEPSVAQDGTLIYVDPPSERLLWLNRQGQRIGEAGVPVFGIFYPAISPDGRRVAAEAYERENQDVWVYDLERGARTRLSSDPASEILPVWSPDGEQVAYSSWRAGNTDILLRQADAGTEEKTLAATPAHERVSDWSRDGKHILYSREDPKSSWDLWYLKRNGTGGWESAAFLQTPFRERAPKFSPNGGYVAYLSDESGRSELYVRPFPHGDQQWVVSQNGAAQPRWARNGKKLFFVQAGTLMETPVLATSKFWAGAPVPLFAHGGFGHGLEPNYDVSPDGERFLVPGPSEQSRERLIHVVQNWFAEFRNRH